MIPCPIVEENLESLSPESLRWLHQLTHFIVERARTARHFIKRTQHPLAIAQLTIHEMTDNKNENAEFLKLTLSGIDIGVISEAGCPGVADPGAEMAEWAHQNQVRVIPLTGPSSILMALMASGLNGQNFAFNGYLANKKPELIAALKVLEQKVYKTDQTQIFMETPYRNGFIMEVLVQTLNERTKLCVACDVNGPNETIKQQAIKEWKKEKFEVLHKRPCIFLIGK